SDLPQVDYPTITVNASLPGANPDTMASAVATPLERQFTTIAGLDSMISNSGQGSTSITLQFNLSRDIDGATVDVETAIAEAMPLLPRSEEHTSELQSQSNLVCRLLLEKKNSRIGMMVLHADPVA